MTAIDQRTTPRIVPTGFLFLAVTAGSASFNWPVMKYLLSEWPPMATRGLCGTMGALLLTAIAIAMKQSLKVPRDVWLRLYLAAFLNITLWVVLMGFAMLWLSASEAVIIAYLMPVITTFLAWPLLGERITPLRVIALFIAFASLAALMAGNGIDASWEKLPGVAMALITAIAYALGTILLKKWPLGLPPVSSAAWQLGLGCFPAAVWGFIYDRPDPAALSAIGWTFIAYNIVLQQCAGYVCWLAALQRLPASVAAISTMVVPVGGVLISAAWLHEPLGPFQIAALICVVGSVALAVRS
jgi:drug/metabolite transporter (DMT)-like permease